MAEWSHYHGNAANAAASCDTLIGWPDQVRFIAGRPYAGNNTRWCSGFTSAAGRDFYVSWVESGDFPPDDAKALIECRDAFNGLLRWHRFLNHDPLNYGWSIVGYTADRDRVYIPYSGGFAALDAATGADCWRITDNDGSSHDEVAVVDGVVIRNGRSLRAFATDTGKLLWRVDTQAHNGAIAVGNGQLFAALGVYAWTLSRMELRCLSLKDGTELWRRNLVDVDGKEQFIYYNALTHVLQYADGKLFFRCNTGNNVWMSIALSAQDGKLLWQTPVRANTPLFCMADGVWNWLTHLDADSGKSLDPVMQIGTYRGSCGMTFAAAHVLISGRLGFIDRQTGETRNYQLTRGGCAQGAAYPANGLSNFTRQTCTCFSMIQGHVSFATDPPDAPIRELPDNARLEHGPAYGKVEAPADGAAADWPTYRHDALRGGCTDALLPTALNLVWSVTAGRDLTAPVSAAGVVYLAGQSEHKVQALRAGDGKPLWSYIAGGPIDSPPTLSQGYAVFGCHDGWVYALRAADGVLAWRYQTAPTDRSMVAFDQVESSWPVFGSVLVQDGVVVAAAGRHVQVDGGIVFTGLELATGKALWTHTAGAIRKPSASEAFINDILRSDGHIAYVTGFGFSGQQFKFGYNIADGTPWRLASGPKMTAPKGPVLSAESGMLVDARYRISLSMNHTEMRRIWYYMPDQARPVYPAVGNCEAYPMNAVNGYRGDLLIFAPNRIFGCARTYGTFDSAKPPKVVTPDPNFPEYSSTQNKLVVYGATDLQIKLWCFDPQRSAFDLRAMAGTADKIFIAFATPNTAKPNAQIIILSADKGEKLGIIDLPSPPRWDGLAIADGKLFISTEDGKLLCLG